MSIALRIVEDQMIVVRNTTTAMTAAHESGDAAAITHCAKNSIAAFTKLGVIAMAVGLMVARDEDLDEALALAMLAIKDHVDALRQAAALAERGEETLQ